MADLTVFHCPGTRSSTVVWLLEELGVAYEVKAVNLYAGEHKTEAFGRMNPSRKVPAITHGATHLAETAAIALYLAEAFPEAGLAPAPGAPKRAEHLFWSVYRAGVLEPSMLALMQGWKTEPGWTSWPAFPEALARVRAGLGESSYLLGEAFSVCDLLIGALLGWARSAGHLPKEDAVLNGYVDRLHARKGFKTMRARDKALKAAMA